MKIALVGNPNCGKSTLFNTLTGSNQRVGNWPGVTVERKSGYFEFAGKRVEVVDLPGLYTLVGMADSESLDVEVARRAIMEEGFDLIVNIVDASNLERHLYLTSQLLDLEIPVLIAANMMDVAAKQGLHLDSKLLSAQLACSVVTLTATQKSEIPVFKKTIIQELQKPTTSSQKKLNYPVLLQETLDELSQKLSGFALFKAISAMEGDDQTLLNLPVPTLTWLGEQKVRLQQHYQEDLDILIADTRYTWANQLAGSVIHKHATKTNTLTQKIDRIVLNRFLGIPIFLGMMYLMFFFAINVGGAFQPFFDITSNAIFVQGFFQLLQTLHVPPTITALLAAGFGTSMNTIMSFIPVIAALFLFLAFLESCGYMARAAFVVDRVMRVLGLPGKSFVPLIIGFGCNVPAMMATRTLDYQRDRLVTLMMSPFMSCGARMAIYAVFISAFFPSNGHNIVFILYLTGILAAVFTGFILRKTVLQGESSPWIIELPNYHCPSLSSLLRHAWLRLRQFVVRAGKIIIPVCLIICTLNAISLSGSIKSIDSANQDSILSVIGKHLTPVFKPMGISDDNWPAVVGLTTGVLAKEVVIGTLNTLYAQLNGKVSVPEAQTSFVEQLSAAVNSIPTQLVGLKDSLLNPIAASSGDATMDDGVLGIMASYFAGTAAAMAYLLFVLLYFPCVSAVATMARESNIRWAVFSVLWTTGLAYAVAVSFYQIATWIKHPFSSSLWILSFIVLFISLISVIKFFVSRTFPKKEVMHAC